MVLVCQLVRDIGAQDAPYTDSEDLDFVDTERHTC